MQGVAADPIFDVMAQTFDLRDNTFGALAIARIGHAFAAAAPAAGFDCRDDSNRFGLGAARNDEGAGDGKAFDRDAEMSRGHSAVSRRRARH